MTFVDTNVIMYAVGGSHPLRQDARRFFEDSLAKNEALATSAEVLQELLHAYIPVGRIATLQGAIELATSTISTVWSLDSEDVLYAQGLVETHPGLGARDLIHLA